MNTQVIIRTGRFLSAIINKAYTGKNVIRIRVEKQSCLHLKMSHEPTTPPWLYGM